MTTPYSISVSKGSQTFQGYVNAPITGPLDSSQYPYSMPYHSYGILTGQKPTPPQFYPGQEPVNSAMNTNARAQYLRTTSISSQEKAKQDASGKLTGETTYVSKSTQRQYPSSQHCNYTAPLPSSMHTNIRKSVAVGKSAYKVGHSMFAPISTKNYTPSTTRSALQRARSSGCTAPKKKGSIYNYSLTQSGINGYGSMPRTQY
jgi:hypothetical protein